MGRQGWQMPSQVFAVQLTLSQPEGENCAPTLLFIHQALGNFLRHYIKTFILLFKIYKAKFLSHKFFLILYKLLYTYLYDFHIW